MSRRSSIRRSSLAALAIASTCISVVDAMPAPMKEVERLQHRASICDSRGYSGNTESYQVTYDSAYSACSAACSKDVNCKSFARGNGECHLFKVPVDGNLQPDSDSPYHYFDITCPKPSTSSATTTAKTTTNATVPTTTTSTVSSTTKSPTTTTTTAKMTTTTTKATTMTTSTTTRRTSSSSTTTKASPTPTPKSNTGLFSFSTDTCTSKTFQDLLNKGCGCSYSENCGGSVGSGEIIEAGLSSVTYGACAAACDARPSECAGFVYQPFYGECWLYKSATGVRKDPLAWFVKKASCAKPCAGS